MKIIIDIPDEVLCGFVMTSDNSNMTIEQLIHNALIYWLKGEKSLKEERTE